MYKEYPKKEDAICEFLRIAKTAKDFYITQGLISDLFYKADPKRINELLSIENNFYIRAFENVINNQNFLEVLKKVLEQFKAFKKNYKEDSPKTFFDSFDELEIENKKILFAALVTSVSFLSNALPNLEDKNIAYAVRKLQSSIKKIRDIFNFQYLSSEINDVLSGVFDRKFYSKIKMPVEIKNLDYVQKQQKISNYLISLSIRLSFRNARLNSLFKSIGKDILNSKFSSWSIYSISSFIRNERNREQKSIEELNYLYGNNNFLDGFIKNFKNNENEENAFNLIELTTEEFESEETREEDLIKTIKDTNMILEKIMDYGIRKFKAFSDEITIVDYEWSNKIFINCCKLFGALNGISKAIDKNKKWATGACVKEFADWALSIHKILNKYDIEDDWDRISKYLNQETNRVEWKSTFFTPTQISRENKQYQAVSKEIFHGLIRTLLGMINSEGGIIIIGFIEKPQEIVRDDIKRDLVEKLGKVFFDISKELSENKMNLDVIKRKMQDSLKEETLVTAETFNNLWDIQPISIKTEDGNKEVIIYKIDVTKSNKMIFSTATKSRGDIVTNINKFENIWISLLKRADARTIYVDPRKYLTP